MNPVYKSFTNYFQECALLKNKTTKNKHVLSDWFKQTRGHLKNKLSITMHRKQHHFFLVSGTINFLCIPNKTIKHFESLRIILCIRFDVLLHPQSEYSIIEPNIINIMIIIIEGFHQESILRVCNIDNFLGWSQFSSLIPANNPLQLLHWNGSFPIHQQKLCYFIFESTTWSFLFIKTCEAHRD